MAVRRRTQRRGKGRPKPGPAIPTPRGNGERDDADALADVPWGRPADSTESSEQGTARVSTRIHRDFDSVRVRTAKYVGSSVELAQCPTPPCPPGFAGQWLGYPDFAFIGRSNVGKSSLINTLTGSDGLALVSKTPGKTKCINHFLINECWYLVDLPGYGYAKTVGKGTRNIWAEFTQRYFLERQSLANVFVLIDGTVPTQDIDREVVEWLADNDVPHSIVFTKCDKKKKKGCLPYEENVEAFKRNVLAELWGADPPPMFVTSSVSAQGKQALLAHIRHIRRVWSGRDAAL